MSASAGLSRVSSLVPSLAEEETQKSKHLFSSAAQKVLDHAKVIVNERDESIKRVELALLNNYSDPLPYDPQFEEEQRTAYMIKLDQAQVKHIADDEGLVDVHHWIKTVAESADIEDRAHVRQMQEWIEEEKDTVNKGLDGAKRLNNKMLEISTSLLTSAKSDHKSLRQKLKEQYFSFQSQLTTLVQNLEEEETKRRSMAMTNIMLKQKLMMVKMSKAKPQNPNRTAESQEENGNAGDGVEDTVRLKATLAQRDLDLAQLRARMDEQKETLDNLKMRKGKQDAEILHLKDQVKSLEEAKEKADSTVREQEKGLENEGRASRLLQATRDSLDRKPYPDIDPDDAEIPSALVQLPKEITNLYKILDEYSNKIKKLEEHMQSIVGGKPNLAGHGSDTELKAALDASPDVQALKKQIEELKEKNARNREKLQQQNGEIAYQMALVEKVKKMRRSGADSDHDDDSSEQGEVVVLDPVTGMPMIDPTTGQLLKRKATKTELEDNAQGRFYASAGKICARLVEFHNNVVDHIIGAGSSKLSKKHLEGMLASAKDTVGGLGVVSTVCEALEEYLRKYWAESGVKDMAQQIRQVTEHNARKSSAHFEHLSELKKLQGMMTEAKENGGKHSKGWLSRIMERYEEQQQRWEAKKRQLVQERADAILSCMSSVLHVVTLNIGIKIQPRDKQDIITSLQASCIGRGNAFWPKQKQATTEIATFESAPNSRAQTAAEKKSSNTSTNVFSITRLPLHRQMPDEYSMRSSRGGDASHRSGIDSFRNETDSFRHRSPRRSESRSSHPYKLEQSDSFRHRSPRSGEGPGSLHVGLDLAKVEDEASARSHRSPRNGKQRGGRPIASSDTSDTGRSPVPGVYPLYGNDEGDASGTDDASVRAAMGSRRGPGTSEREGPESLSTLAPRPSPSPTLRNWSQSPPARPRLLVSPAERNAGRLKSRDSSRVLGHSKLPSISKAKLPLQSSVAFHDDMYPAEPWNEVAPEIHPYEYEFSDLRNSVNNSTRMHAPGSSPLDTPGTPEAMIKIHTGARMRTPQPPAIPQGAQTAR